MPKWDCTDYIRKRNEHHKLNAAASVKLMVQVKTEVGGNGNLCRLAETSLITVHGLIGEILV